MAFPQVTTVGAVYSSATASKTTHDIAVPASVASGDLLLVVAAIDGIAGTPSMPGFTVLIHDTGSSQRLWVAYKIADGTESGTITLTTPIEQCGAQMWRITAWHGTAAPEGASVDGGSSASEDPPSLTPSWGSADTLWIACFAINGGHGGITTWSLPDNQYQLDSTGSSGSVGFAVCSDELAQATLDPVTFVSSAGQFWTSGTIAIRPSAGGPTTSLPLRRRGIPHLIGR